MAISGEIASLFVRIRPNVGGFAAETTAGVKGALAGVQTELTGFSQATATAAAETVTSNQKVAASYADVGTASMKSADTAKDATISAARQQTEAVRSTARANLIAIAEQVRANQDLAASYLAVGKEAGVGSDMAKIAAVEAAKATAEANHMLGTTVDEGAKKVSFLREHILNLGSALGIAFGTSIAVKFVKGVTESAASVQKSAEVIKNSFGKSASEVLVRFGDTVASKLGISAELADATSAKFGILFRNLGIGQTEAAGMTINLERLAGSLSAIKGVDPTQALQQITLAMLGNTRSLKQLGLAVDPASEKIAALKLGLISSVHDALTPAIRAQAIYALATAHLGAFQTQAAAHAGDYANVQRRLSAEYSNAKDILGTALLPMFTKYTSELGKWLERMIQSGKLQKDFNAVAVYTRDIISEVASAVRTGWHVFETAAGWIGGAKNAIKLLLAVMAVKVIQDIGGSIGRLVGNIQKIGEAARASAVLFGISSAAIGADAEATSLAVKSALISTGIGAIAVAAGVAAVLIIEHWNKVKQWLVDFGHWISGHAEVLFAVPVIGAVLFMAVEVIKHFNDIKGVVMDVAHFFGTVFVHPIRAIENLFSELKNVVERAFHALERDAVLTALKIVEPFSHLPSFLGGGAFRSLKTWLQGQLAALSPIAYDYAAFVGKSFTAGFTSAFGQSFGAVGDFVKKVGAAIVKDPTLAQGTTTAAAKRAAEARIAAIKAAGAAERAAAARTIRDNAASLAQETASANAQVVAAVGAAKKNLDAIGQKLAETVNKLLGKGAGGGDLGTAAQRAAIAHLKDVLASGGDTTAIERAGQALSTELQAQAGTGAGAATLKTRQDAVKQHFHDLVAEFNKGQISLVTFNKRVAELLAKDGVTYKNVGKKLGTAFADAFQSEMKAIHAQAAAIAELPARLRGKGGAGTDLKVIQPLTILRTDNARIAARAEKQREQQLKQQQKIAAAAAKQTALLQRLATTKVAPLPGTAGRHAKHASQAGAQP